MRAWNIIISGFQQDTDKPTGLEHLWKEMRALANDHVCVTMPLVWKTKWSNIAEFIFRNSAENIRLGVYAYSWGAGWGFVNLAKELKKRGICVDVAVLSDPVYRNPLISLSWLSMTSIPKITVPANVREIYWFYQRQNRPAGHDLKAEVPEGTVIHEGVKIENVTHQYMDDLKAFHARAMIEARQVSCN